MSAEHNAKVPRRHHSSTEVVKQQLAIKFSSRMARLAIKFSSRMARLATKSSMSRWVLILG